MQQMLGEPGSYPAFSPSSLSSPPLFPQPQLPNSGTTPTSTPAFLSRFPRSLSSLSLGTKKKSIDSKEISSPTAATLFGSPECLSPTDGLGGPFAGGGLTSAVGGGTPTKTKKYSASSAADHHHHHHLHGNHHHMNRSGHFGGSGKQQQHTNSDIPPPLPQRNNIPKKSEDMVDMMMVGSRRNILVSDLDHQLVGQDTSSLHSAGSSGSASSKASSGGGKSSRGKKKNGGSHNTNNSSSSSSNGGNNKNSNANNNTAMESPIGDANMTTGSMAATATSTTELQAEPPPLPPRQPGMLEVVNQNLIMNSDNNAGSNCTNNSITGPANGNNNNGSSGVGGRGSIEMRPPPNSINTLMNYPLITTCTSVRDNMAAAFPLSYRPNIVHQMQQHQQTTVSSQETVSRNAEEE
uniref:Uncharacterized protein n=1 Tax=Anopheles maculatus TaxID=74869 RepID=A0A182SEQ1_9DIPT